jgi:hypothetical protein
MDPTASSPVVPPTEKPSGRYVQSSIRDVIVPVFCVKRARAALVSRDRRPIVSNKYQIELRQQRGLEITAQIDQNPMAEAH